jgi:hypothetical protein
MNPFRFIRALFSYTSQRILPPQLQPGYWFRSIRSRLERWTTNLESAAEQAAMKKPTVPRRPWWHYALHILGLVVIVLVLWWLNYVLDLDKVLRAPWPVLHQFWLPMLFLLGYALYWLGRILWKLLAPVAEISEFPDIDEAWDEGLAALKQAGIAVSQVPLFLVLGHPRGSTKEFFDSSQMNLPVRHIPRKREAPIHFTATPEGIWITCEGASLMGRQVDILHENASPTAPTTPAEPSMEEIPDGPPPIEYEQSGESMAQQKAELAEAEALHAGASPSPVLLMADQPAGAGLRLRKNRAPLLKNNEEVTRLTARLQHLCHLVTRVRQPFCPINGVLVILPLAATANIEDASQTGAVCQHDLATLRASLQVHAPMLVVLADMEQVPGFCELLEQFPEAKQRQFVLGQPFPLMPDLDQPDVPRMIGKGITWLFETLFPANVYKLLRAEQANQPRGTVLRANGKLYQLLVEMRERYRGLNHILTRSLGSSTDGPLLFGGCFLAATGTDPAREQAFVHGVLRQMIENQNYVSWTKEAMAEEAEYLRWTRLGYLVILAMVVTTVMLGYWYWPRS